MPTKKDTSLVEYNKEISTLSKEISRYASEYVQHSKYLDFTDLYNILGEIRMVISFSIMEREKDQPDSLGVEVG